MSFPRYPKYKPSDVEWLGEVPEGWAAKPLKHIADFINGDAFKPNTWSESGFPIIRIQNLNGSEDFNYFDGTIESRYLVHDGDLLFGWSGNRGTSFGPFLWRRSEVCVLNQHIFRVVPKSLCKRALYWTLKAVTAHVEDQAHGIIGMVHITKGDLGAIAVPLPPLPEQTAIAEFLDRETRKIDELVAEQRRLMELLKEKRQAVISHAVTKGLNPNVPFKPSGIEWLGDVPKHWTIATVRRLVQRIEQGWSPDCLGRPAETDEWGVVKSGCVNRGVFVEVENKALPDTLEPLPEYEIRVGDVLMSRASGSPELVGSTAYISTTRSKLMLSDKIFRIHPKQNIDRRFFVAVFNSRVMRAQIERAISGADGLANNLPQSAMKDFFCVVPPLLEQQAIVAHLDTELAKFDALTAEAQRAIDLLQERRTALISAAVTGQIDVRQSL